MVSMLFLVTFSQQIIGFYYVQSNATSTNHMQAILVCPLQEWVSL